MELKIHKYPERTGWNTLQLRPELDVTTLFDTVRAVLEDVKTAGDEAVRRYGERYD
jgi:histidinol dehydrogenase